MMDYARQRAAEILKTPNRAVLVTSGPGGVQASEFPCEAHEAAVFLLVPRTSDHLFNLEANPAVILVSGVWVVKGKAETASPGDNAGLKLAYQPDAAWNELVRVQPESIQVLKPHGWGFEETIELIP